MCFWTHERGEKKFRKDFRFLPLLLQVFFIEESLPLLLLLLFSHSPHTVTRNENEEEEEEEEEESPSKCGEARKVLQVRDS